MQNCYQLTLLSTYTVGTKVDERHCSARGYLTVTTDNTKF